MNKLFLFLISVVLITGLCSCTTGSGFRVNSTEKNTLTMMSMSYDKFNGYKQTKLDVKDNSPVVVSVHFVTNKGSIDAYIAKNNDTAISSYSGHDIQTSSFTVTLTEPGNYTIRVDAHNHSGSFSFSWGK